jgi:hypothetical protein
VSSRARTFPLGAISANGADARLTVPRHETAYAFADSRKGVSMGEETVEKKGGFFRKLFKITAILAAIGAIVMFWKRKQGADLDDVEWQELPPPAGG